MDDGSSGVVFAHSLVIAAIVVLGIGFWHQRKVDGLREEQGAEIFDAIRLDEMAISASVPVLLAWAGLQLTSVVVFLLSVLHLSSKKRAVAATTFGTLWSLSWICVCV
jgi:hypothetical protein